MTTKNPPSWFLIFVFCIIKLSAPFSLHHSLLWLTLISPLNLEILPLNSDYYRQMIIQYCTNIHLSAESGALFSYNSLIHAAQSGELSNMTFWCNLIFDVFSLISSQTSISECFSSRYIRRVGTTWMSFVWYSQEYKPTHTFKDSKNIFSFHSQKIYLLSSNHFWRE